MKRILSAGTFEIYLFEIKMQDLLLKYMIKHNKNIFLKSVSNVAYTNFDTAFVKKNMRTK